MVPVNQQIKAIYAGIVAALTGGITALQSDGITATEWLTIALATVVAYGGVYGLANKEADK